MKKGNGTATARPKVKEPNNCCTVPTSMGPMAAPKGVKVRISPVASAISRGCSLMSNGMVITIGITTNANIPAKKRAAARATWLGVIRSIA